MLNIAVLQVGVVETGIIVRPLAEGLAKILLSQVAVQCQRQGRGVRRQIGTELINSGSSGELLGWAGIASIVSKISS